MDTNKLFNETLPAALQAHSDEAKAVGAKFQFNIADAGEWFVDLTQTGPTCNPGKGTADCTFNISAKDFEYLLKNPQAHAMQLFFSGKLRIVGNQMLGLKLKNILEYVK